MASQQMIEQIYNNEFNLTKTIAGAGPYAIEKSLDSFYLIQNQSLGTNTFTLIEAAFNSFQNIYGSYLGTRLQPFHRHNGRVYAFQHNFITKYKTQNESRYRLTKQF